MTRSEAKLLGLKRYTPSIPCVKGHRCEKYVCDNKCVECARLTLAERYVKNRESEIERHRLYRLKNSEIVRERSKLAIRERRKAQPDVFKEYNRRKHEKIKADPDKLEKERARQRLKQKKAYEKDPEKLKARSRTYRTSSPEKIQQVRDKCKEYKKKNPDVIRMLNQKHNGKDRAARIKRVPSWLTEDDHRIMKAIYDEARSKGLHVDHIIPLQGKNVSGLHVPNNLQLLTRSENSSKKNSYTIQ